MAVTRPSYVPSPIGTELLAHSVQMQAYLLSRAEAAAEAARAIAPVDTGAYRDSIEGVATVEDGRPVAILTARDFKAHWIEFGSPTIQARGTLRNACDATGLEIRSLGDNEG